MAMKNMSLQLKDDNILVMAFNPGWVKTIMGGKKGMISTEECALKMDEMLSKQGKDDHGVLRI